MLFSVRHGNISTVASLIDKYGVSCDQWAGGYNLLLESLKYKRTAVAKLLLSNGAKVNSENSNISQPTPLHIAVENNEREMIELLLEMGAAINIRGGKRKCTPLFEAVYLNKRDITELLLRKGALIDVPNDESVTPLRAAVDRGYADLVRMLLQHGANVNSAGEYSKHSGFTPLHVAALKGSLDMLELLLDSGAEVNPASSERTPLHIAVEKGFKDVAEILLNRNADVNVQTADSLTPLHIAVERGFKNIVEMLLARGASVNVPAKTFTPLHLAVREGDIDLTETLLNAGSDIDAVAEDRTPLLIAVEEGVVDIVRCLLYRGAHVNAASTDSRTPLHVAVEHNKIDIADMLLRSGADPNAMLKDGRTALHIAAQLKSDAKSADLVEMLLDNGADVNAKTNDCNTPLHMSIRNNCKDFVRIFLERGANVDSKDQESMTPLCLAVENGCLVILDFVLKFHPDVSNESNQNALSMAIRKEGEKEEILKRLLEYGFSVKPEDAFNREITSCVIRNGFVRVAEEIFQYATDTLLEFNLMPLHLATIFKQIEMAKILLKHGADVNAKDKVGRSSIYFATANSDYGMFKLFLAHDAVVKDPCELLHLAAKSGCLEIVKTLLECGCDVDSRDDRGRTVLHNTNFSLEPLRITPFFPRYLKSLRLSADEVDTHSRIAEYLLMKGATVDARDNNGETPLHIAAHDGLDRIVEVLIRHQADVNSYDKYADTALDRAVRFGRLNLTRILLEAGAEVNFILRQLNGKPSPLHLAVKIGDKELVKLLLNYGANANAVCKEGAAIHMAVQSKVDLDLLRILLEHCAIDAYCGEGSALHLAAQYCLKDMVEILLEHGADINMTDKNECTPIDCARGSSDGSEDTFSLLLDHLAKMKAAGLYVSPQNSRYLEAYPCVTFSRVNLKWPVNLSDYLLECSMEVDIMKLTKIDDSSLSFYDILTKSVHQMVKVLRNNSVLLALNLNTHCDIFPIYASMISNKLELGKRRKELDEECRRVFFVNYFPGLPDICIDRIITYLTNGELKILNRICTGQTES